MEHLKVACLQLLPTGSLEENFKKGVAACKKAKEMGADIALFPEMWSFGYALWDDSGKALSRSELHRHAIPAESEFVTGFGALAKKLDMAIGVTFLESYDPSPRNTLRLYDRHGNPVLTYAKVHTCDFDVEGQLTPGEEFYVADLDVGGETVKIGAMICYDREFPESARILMLKGAEVILTPNACPMEINRLGQLRGRSFENMLGIVTVNYPAGKPDCNGHSNAFDGVAYLSEVRGSRDIMILDAGEKEGVYIADFQLEMMREYRRNEVHGNAYRHPKKYRLLVEEHIEEPFVRADYRA